MQITTALSLLKCAVAFIGAGSLVAAALLLVFRSGELFRNVVPAGVLALLSVVVLTRGAPHNNPLLFEAYDAHGSIVLFAAIAVVAAIGVAGAWLSYRRPADLSPKAQWWIVSGLALLAMLAATEPVARLWNIAQWGDSIFYDRIAISIARGDFPAGHSYYMPVFQYGSALSYWLFGHFIFVQQIVNVLLAPLTVVFLALAALNFFGRGSAVLLVALLAATVDQLRHAPYLVQIENWYVPLFSCSLWAASRYLRWPERRNATMLGAAAGLIFQTRTQAALYVGWLALSPFLSRDTTWQQRFRHAVLALALVVLLAGPWLLRNVVVDGRVSPIGTQAGQHITFAMDESTLFGIRRDLTVGAPRTTDVASPSPSLLLHAVWWRSLTFYGLLPPGAWDKRGPRTTMLAEIPSYLLRTAATWALLAASLLGLLLRPSRTALFLLGAIGSNIALVLAAPFSEPRLSYPVLAAHILLVPAAIWPWTVRGAEQHCSRLWSRTVAAAVGVLAVVAAFALHFAYGRTLLYSPQTDSPLMTIGPVSIDQSLPDLNALLLSDVSNPEVVQPGIRVRMKLVVSNAMHPVKWYSFPVQGFPAFTADPRREAYYLAHLLDTSGDFQWGVSRSVGVALIGARIDRPLREDEGIEAEGMIVHGVLRGTFWFQAEKIQHLDKAPNAFERFPKRGAFNPQLRQTE
jgi:hypothetical protein